VGGARKWKILVLLHRFLSERRVLLRRPATLLSSREFLRRDCRICASQFVVMHGGNDAVPVHTGGRWL